MPFRILSVAYPLFPVSPASGGGAEQILQLLDAALVKAGHHSTVVAAAGSDVSGDLVATPSAPPGAITDAIRAEAQAHHRKCIQDVLERQEIDLIHFHGFDFLSYRPQSPSIPQVATLHLPIDWYPADLFQQQGLTLNCVSASQARSRTEARTVPIVGNGIDLNRFTFSATKKNYLLWLGRICPEKGTDIALRVAHSLNLPLVVAGPVHPFEFHQAYFDEKVAPLLDQEHCYVGPVNHLQRAELLSGARCLLVPALAQETSSLVAMEAAASGTPVIAFAAGALTEIIEDGNTGWLVHSESEMSDAVYKSGEIVPETCRRVAETRFSAEQMALNYLSLYRSILNSYPARE